MEKSSKKKFSTLQLTDKFDIDIEIIYDFRDDSQWANNCLENLDDLLNWK